MVCFEKAEKRGGKCIYPTVSIITTRKVAKLFDRCSFTFVVVVGFVYFHRMVGWQGWLGLISRSPSCLCCTVLLLLGREDERSDVVRPTSGMEA